MKTLPRVIVALDGSLREAGRYELVPAGQGVRQELKERDYDELIVRHSDVLASLLREGELIGTDSSLKPLGRQLAGIDVLLAEVGPKGSFRQLVLVEDKLLRNPEAKRTVLAQILDYAHRVQYELSADELLGEATDEAWVTEYREEIDNSLGTGECLLLICGDEIDPRMARLAERFARDANPLSRYTLAVLSLNLYSDGQRHLLVPALVQSVTSARRELTIRVTVVDSLGNPVATEQTLAADETPGGGKAGTEEDFFRRNWARFPPSDVEACREVFKTLEGAGIPGLRLETLPSGRPSVLFEGTSWGTVKVLWATQKRPMVRDTSDRNGAMKKDERAAELWESFREALRGVNGADAGRGPGRAVLLPVRALREDQCRGLIQALRKFRQELGAESAAPENPKLGS